MRVVCLIQTKIASIQWFPSQSVLPLQHKTNKMCNTIMLKDEGDNQCIAWRCCLTDTSQRARGNSVHTIKLCGLTCMCNWVCERVAREIAMESQHTNPIRYTERDAFRYDEILFDNNTSYLIWFDLVSVAMSIFMHINKDGIFTVQRVCLCVCVYVCLVQDFISFQQTHKNSHKLSIFFFIYFASSKSSLGVHILMCIDVSFDEVFLITFDF